MFKLIKLAIYAAIGYALWELFRGMRQEQGAGGGRRSFGQGRHYGAMTGGGTGMRESTADETGSEMTHAVGRGVVS